MGDEWDKRSWDTCISNIAHKWDPTRLNLRAKKVRLEVAGPFPILTRTTIT